MVLIVGGSYQGKTEFAKKNFPKAQVFNNCHVFIKKHTEDGLNQEQILEEIHHVISEGDWVVISDEIGNGIVPMDADERRWRENTGRILIQLAKEASEVYRVTVGIGQRIK